MRGLVECVDTHEITLLTRDVSLWTEARARPANGAGPARCLAFTPQPGRRLRVDGEARQWATSSSERGRAVVESECRIELGRSSRFRRQRFLRWPGQHRPHPNNPPARDAATTLAVAVLERWTRAAHDVAGEPRPAGSGAGAPPLDRIKRLTTRPGGRPPRRRPRGQSGGQFGIAATRRATARCTVWSCSPFRETPRILPDRGESSRWYVACSVSGPIGPLIAGPEPSNFTNLTGQDKRETPAPWPRRILIISSPWPRGRRDRTGDRNWLGPVCRASSARPPACRTGPEPCRRSGVPSRRDAPRVTPSPSKSRRAGRPTGCCNDLVPICRWSARLCLKGRNACRQSSLTR